MFCGFIEEDLIWFIFFIKIYLVDLNLVINFVSVLFSIGIFYKIWYNRIKDVKYFKRKFIYVYIYSCLNIYMVCNIYVYNYVITNVVWMCYWDF